MMRCGYGLREVSGAQLDPKVHISALVAAKNGFTAGGVALLAFVKRLRDKRSAGTQV